MSFSISISGHAASPAEEAELKDRLSRFLDEVHETLEVTIASAGFFGQYGKRDYLAEAAPAGTVGGVAQDERFQPGPQPGEPTEEADPS